MQWLVPLMALWVSTSLDGMIHIDEVPNVIVTIFQSAFGWREAASGAGLHPTHSLRVFSGVCSPTKRKWAPRRMPPQRPHPGPHIPPRRQTVQMITPQTPLLSAPPAMIMLAGAAEQPSSVRAVVKW